MDSAGSALMGIGTATGEKRAEDAAKSAISSPLLELSIAGARGVLFSVAGGDDLSMLEIQDAASVITESIDPNAKVIFGAVQDPKLKKNEVKVTVIATGFPENPAQMGSRSSSLFQLPKKDSRKDESEKESKIYNSVGILGGIGLDDDKKTEQKVEEKKENDAKKDNENDDDWGAVPAFLRRSKLK
jgi:cell division protein FtsZ